MRSLLLLCLLQCILAQIYYRPVQQVQQRPVQQQRQVYYPVRTNCQPACNQNRYRWNYRPTNVRPMVNIRPQVPMRPVAPVAPVAPVMPQTQGPTQAPTTQWTYVFKPNTTTATVATPSSSVPTLPTPAPSSSTIATSPSTERSTTESTTVTTTERTTERSTESTTTEAEETSTLLPTPPPEGTSKIQTLGTTASEATSHETTLSKGTTTTATEATTRYMRPERKEGTFFNPCPSGRALTNEFDSPISCNHLIVPNGGCPEDYWCHTGATFATTACCPRVDNSERCDLRRDTGEGAELVARWYFDRQAKICKRFLYKGTHGNANNFVTKSQCVDICESAVKIDESNPCKLGTPARVSNGTRSMCGPTALNMCPDGYYCHVGVNPELTACCESSGLTDPCLLALNIGQGSSSMKRFYYNTFVKRCTEFQYKGTKGNENNFLNFKDCQETCQKWTNPCPTVINYSLRRECTVNGTECGRDQWCHVGDKKETTICCPEVSADPCVQPVQSGEGGADLPRWYADPNDKSCSRQCKPFTYGGAKGNQNNFVSKELCEQKCKRECKSPCGSGDMLLTPSNEPRYCSPSSPCPNTHWCHVGITPDTTVCCSAVPNTCDLPIEKGYGLSHLTRWHFNRRDNKCQKFIYSGEGGNQNMFLTQDDCLAVCPVYENPCGTGKPLMVGTKPKVCNPSERCPSTHFCHIGVEANNNFCCPKIGDPCDQPLSSGTGGLALTRFFYDKDTRRCREFAYQAKKGNANNFLNQEDCEIVCPVLPNPCKLGEPLLSADKEPVICGGEDTCDNGFFCHVGATPETTNCCPGTRKPCDLPMENGEGAHSLERWYYDGGLQICRQFNYKGMKGNSNNFLTKSACRQACKELNPCGYGEPFQGASGDNVQCNPAQKSESCPNGFYCHIGGSTINTICCPKRNVDACDQSVNEGAGGEDLPRWFFDKKQNRCAPFTYGGIAGNENNFISSQVCQTVCPVYRNYCPHGIPLIDNAQVQSCGIDRGCPDGFICHMSSEYNVSVCCQDPMDFCLSPRDPGPCNAFETRYGYNPLTDTCIEYKYGGCDGTVNNFRSLQRCTEICCKEYHHKH